MNMQDSPNPKIAPDDWDRIARYLAGEAEPHEMEATAHWVAADAERAAMVNALQSALANVSRDDAADVDVEGALKSVKSKFEIPRVIPSVGVGHERRSWIRSPYLRAAAVLLLVVGAFWWRNFRETSGTSVARAFNTSVGERRQFGLADGTQVVLGPASRLTVDPNSDDRSVVVDGDAYFSVVHNVSHPFTVRVGAVTIEDVGTAFAVQMDDSGGVRVAVDSGSVTLGPKESGAGSKEVLRARDKASVDPKGLVMIERSAVSEDDLAWMQGRLVFRDAPLIEVGAELYRWYGVRLRVADSSLVNLHLTASFSGESVDRVLNVIALSLGARIERQGNVATLFRTSTTALQR
jgi:transmembrane sensor